MRELTLVRVDFSSQGSFGFMIVGSVCFYTGELPWRNNSVGLSCIPKGSYTCEWTRSPRFGWVYGVLSVPGRSAVLIHAMNFLGDIKRGLKADSRGCIGLGFGLGVMQGQRAILNSRLAMQVFHREMVKQPFKLTILEQSEDFYRRLVA